MRDQLVRCQRGGERPEEERRRRNQPAAGRTDKREFGIAGDRDAGHLGGRVGMRQAAANGAALADLVMRNMRDGSGKERMRGRETCVRLDVAPADPCAKVNAGIVHLNGVETRYAAEIDQHARCGQAKRQKRHEALATGEQLRRAVAGCQKRHSLLHCCGACIVKFGKLHGDWYLSMARACLGRPWRQRTYVPAMTVKVTSNRTPCSIASYRGGSISRAPRVRARISSSGAARPKSVKARRTASTVEPNTCLRFSRAQVLEPATIFSDPWKCGIT